MCTRTPKNCPCAHAAIFHPAPDGLFCVGPFFLIRNPLVSRILCDLVSDLMVLSCRLFGRASKSFTTAGPVFSNAQLVSLQLIRRFGMVLSCRRLALLEVAAPQNSRPRYVRHEQEQLSSLLIRNSAELQTLRGRSGFFPFFFPPGKGTLSSFRWKMFCHVLDKMSFLPLSTFGSSFLNNWKMPFCLRFSATFPFLEHELSGCLCCTCNTGFP